ncbi:hypothetical protein OF83DRAFT_144751 [Amylostereum chailletii]|nr:hypothetical protein OF83DRAFT_144751 [Amylostereum chailletii]
MSRSTANILFLCLVSLFPRHDQASYTVLYVAEHVWRVRKSWSSPPRVLAVVDLVLYQDSRQARVYLLQETSVYPPILAMSSESQPSNPLPDPETQDASSVPIHRIPDELLSKIFLTRRELSKIFLTRRELSGPFDWGVEDPPWMTITHVCRRWRSVAVNDPLLWGQISMELHPQWFILCLERSDPAPVDVVFDMTKRGADELKAVVFNLHRIQHMHFVGSPSSVRTFLEILTRLPAPLLESFGYQEYPGDRPSDKVIWLPRNIFAGHHPRLKGLELGVNARLPTPCSFVEQDQMMSYVSRGGPSLKELRYLIHKSPRLRFFHYTNEFEILYIPRQDDNEPGTNTGAITLPEMHTFQALETKLSWVLHLLDNVFLPYVQALTLSARLDDGWRTNIETLAQAIASHIPALEKNFHQERKEELGPEKIRHMELRVSSDVLSITLSPGLETEGRLGLSDLGITNPDRYPLELSFMAPQFLSQLPVQTDDIVYLLYIVLRHLGATVGQLRVLTIVHPPRLQTDEWRIALASLINIETLIVKKAAPSAALLDAVLPGHAHPGATAVALPVPLYPRLRRVVVSDIWRHGEFSMDQTEKISPLISACARGGRELDLIIEGCGDSASAVAEKFKGNRECVVQGGSVMITYYGE